MIDYRYPGVDYWEAGSRKSAAWLAKLIQELMNMRMVKVRSHYVRFFENRNLIGYDAKLDLGESVSIKFLDDEAGSTLKISLFLEDKDRDIFLVIWQNLINSGYVFDEVFKRDLTAKNKEKDIKSETSQNDAGEKKQIPPIYANDLLQVEKLSMEGLTIIEMATRLSRSVSTIKRYRKILGIRRRRK